MTKYIDYTFYLYKGDRTAAYSTRATISDIALDLLKYQEAEFDRVITDILEGLKHTSIIDDYDIGRKVSEWPKV